MSLGHAGLFSTAQDLYSLLSKLMFAGENDTPINRTTIDLFIKEYNQTQVNDQKHQTRYPQLFSYEIINSHHVRWVGKQMIIKWMVISDVV